ncbi:glycosyltransferase [Vibrio alfacsensis]|uniref:glycosyltransferase n=1 Tax=Vibrio alfacsensis TaxID=1074311 RepID=UPI001BEDDEF6|nr:glycosyltransferase [Vibrio alfacsensis]BCN27296.1 glycoside hydrolase [Vibrio alfacsensis]
MNKNDKIHVCHLVYSFDIGGLERVIANCITTLDKDHYHHSIIALTEIGSFISEIDVDIDSYSLNKISGHDFKSHLKLYDLLKKIKPDVLHSYNLSTIEYHWLAPLVGVKLRVHAEHGRDSYDINGSVTKYKILRRVMSPFINRFIAVSEDLSDWLKYEVHIYNKKVVLINNGIDTEYYRPNPSDLPLKHSFAEKFVFGHVSRLHPIKNQAFIIDSFIEACRQSPHFDQNCILVIVGDGPDKEKLEQRVAGCPEIADKIIFTGAKTNVRDYYDAFDVFVMASLAEGIPMTLLESMSMSVPHLVTAVGGIKEVTVSQVTGVSIPNDELDTYSSKMVELFENKQDLESFSDNSRKRIVKYYSQDAMVESYHQLYQTAIN